MSLGSELRNARETRKITLDAISERTKIARKYLEALEENHFDVFPSHTYAKSFIRAYAKYVGLDPQILTRQFNSEVAPVSLPVEPMNAEAEMEKAMGWRPLAGRTPSVKRVEAPADDLQLEMVEEDAPRPSRFDPAVLKQKARIFGRAKWVALAGRSFLGLAVLALLAFVLHSAWTYVAGLDLGRSSVKVSPEAPKAYAPSQVQDKYQHLILKGLDRSWVLVTMDDGQTSSELNLDEGEVKTYQALRNFKVRLGNAGGVDLHYNGRPLGILGAFGQVVEIELPGGLKTQDRNS